MAATVADHVAGHETAETWDEFILAPLQSLCDRCHNATKQQVERIGYSTEMDASGWPTDPNHPTNVRARGRP
jgi:5-methylcytosine-specific restriction enzyme A